MQPTEENRIWAEDVIAGFLHLRLAPQTETMIALHAKILMKIIHDEEPSAEQYDDDGEMKFRDTQVPGGQKRRDYVVEQMAERCQINYPQPHDWRLLYQQLGWRPADGQWAKTVED